jgi:hypothetical protein
VCQCQCRCVCKEALALAEAALWQAIIKLPQAATAAAAQAPIAAPPVTVGAVLPAPEEAARVSDATAMGAVPETLHPELQSCPVSTAPPCQRPLPPQPQQLERQMPLFPGDAADLSSLIGGMNLGEPLGAVDADVGCGGGEFDYCYEDDNFDGPAALARPGDSNAPRVGPQNSRRKLTADAVISSQTVSTGQRTSRSSSRHC